MPPRETHDYLQNVWLRNFDFSPINANYRCMHGVATLHVGKGGYKWRYNCPQCNAATESALRRVEGTDRTDARPL